MRLVACVNPLRDLPMTLGNL